MKKYIKILSVATATQLIGFVLTYIFDSILQNFNVSTIAPIFVGFFFVVLSMILSCFLAIRWYKTKKAALITCLLLPTNYTWLILIGLIIQFVETLLGILNKIPYNFG